MATVSENREDVGTQAYLYAFDMDGHLEWKARINSTSASVAVGHDGGIYISDHGYLRAFSSDGYESWRFPMSTGGSSPTVMPEGTILVGSEDGVLYAIGPDGDMMWSFDAASPIHSTVCLDWQDGIYFASEDRFFALDSGGELRWSLDIQGGNSAVVGGDGTIYIGSDEGYLYAINPDGNTLWSRDLGSEVWTPGFGGKGEKCG